MVAFVTGSGLGLQNTSLKLIGSDQAAAGNPNTGRALEQVYVNAANGNLIIQRQDDLLVSAGIDMVSLRTYNSQGVIAADKLNSGWRMSAVMSLANASAGINPNAAGSQILRTDRDGSSYLYAYNSSGAYAGKYTRADDPGARDAMSYASGSKRWTLDAGRWTRATATPSTCSTGTIMPASCRAAPMRMATPSAIATTMTAPSPRSGTAPATNRSPTPTPASCSRK